MKRIIKLILAFVVLLLVTYVFYFYFYNRKTLTIYTINDSILYRAESALTPREQQTGLMYRKYLAPRTGMIFVFDPPRVAHMWMKNTFIPLDMVFFDYMGRIVHVHHNAIPHDETVIPSIVPVAGVLEINAGEAEKYDIKPGSRLDLTTFQ